MSVKRRLLVVEDDPGIREALADLLEELGYQTLLADRWPPGPGAGAAAGRALPILLDWRLPVLDGAAFLEGLRSLPRGAEFPVILSTADRSVLPSATWGWWESSPSPSTSMRCSACSTRRSADCDSQSVAERDAGC